MYSGKIIEGIVIKLVNAIYRKIVPRGTQKKGNKNERLQL